MSDLLLLDDLARLGALPGGELLGATALRERDEGLRHRRVLLDGPRRRGSGGKAVVELAVDDLGQDAAVQLELDDDGGPADPAAAVRDDATGGGAHERLRAALADGVDLAGGDGAAAGEFLAATEGRVGDAVARLGGLVDRDVELTPAEQEAVDQRLGLADRDPGLSDLRLRPVLERRVEFLVRVDRPLLRHVDPVRQVLVLRPVGDVVGELGPGRLGRVGSVRELVDRIGGGPDLRAGGVGGVARR